MNGARPGMTDKINIAFVIDTIETPAAGTEKQLLWLLSELDRSRFKPYLICLRQSKWLRGRNLPCDVIFLGLNRIASPQTASYSETKTPVSQACGEFDGVYKSYDNADKRTNPNL